jgi:2-polyprenyl-3-methyl-5-hydroxy-6-metoxy-1,4-benzoquinol methylase
LTDLATKQTQDKAGQAHWDRIWTETEAPDVAAPPASGRGSLKDRRFEALFRQIFSTMQTEGKTLLEVGCAQSRWLPYFAREFGFSIWGLDYSEIGCQQERQLLNRAGIPGEIVCADLFAPPETMCGEFDVVTSFGVVEHFEDTAACIGAMAKFLKPGGMVLTFIPNQRGAIGCLQKLFNRPVYEMHVPLRARDLRAAHEAAGLRVARCHYFLSMGFGVVELSGLDPDAASTRSKWFLLNNLIRLSTLNLMLENRVAPLPTTRLLSPYVVCVAHSHG